MQIPTINPRPKYCKHPAKSNTPYQKPNTNEAKTVTLYPGNIPNSNKHAFHRTNWNAGFCSTRC